MWAAAALILGLGTRWIALPLALDVLTATLLVHVKNGLFAQNGGYELTLLLGAACLALASLGSGALALDNRFRQAGREADPSRLTVLA